jgi:GAF domain-containing protein
VEPAHRQYEQTLIDRNRDLQISREEQIAYTRTVERRFAYLEAAARVTWETAAIPELASLWQPLVTLICTEFSFYHVAIWLLDEPHRQLILQAASGAEGLRRLAREAHLELMESPDLETVVWRGESRVCRAASREHALPTEIDFFADPDLPEARTILWLPLRQAQGGEVFGILALYSREADAFDRQDTLVLQALADQSAMLINQARLRVALQESLQTAERVSGRVARESWQHWLRAEGGRSYRYGSETADTLTDMSAALPELLLPLRVRGQVLGQIVAHKLEGAWTAEENAMLETLMAQLEQALDSARLYEVTQRRALREQLTREITDHIRASLTVEEAMRRAVQEVARVLRATETVGRIGAERTLLPPEEVANHE